MEHVRQTRTLLTSSATRTFVQLMVIVVAGKIFQASAQLSCPTNWTLYRDQCYLVYTKLLSWQGALDVCKIDGAYLSQIGDVYTNDFIGNLASSAGAVKFWIGLNRITVPDNNTVYLEWSDGSPSSVYDAFWGKLQPNLAAGKCVFIFGLENKYRWSFGPCEWKNAFVCQLSACPTGSYHCSSGECVQSARLCDGVEDCADGSDEISCSLRCKTYIQGTRGMILSPNYPSAYPNSIDCQWTLEGPLESNIILQFSSLDTETGVDEVVIMGGGKTAFSTYSLARVSGTAKPSASFCSFNNFMVVRFYSDGAAVGSGFNLTWTAVSTGFADSGASLIAGVLQQELHSPFYPNLYLTNQETLWIISAPPRSIITLTRQNIDLAVEDFLYVRDGPNAGALLLAEYKGIGGPLHIFSTQMYLYILMKTSKNIDVTHSGFSFTYKTGCTVTLTANAGEIFSPGYGVNNYPDYTTCVYTISPSVVQTLTLIFDAKYDVDYDYDHLQVYIGSDTSGNAMHDLRNGGFVGNIAPAPIVAGFGRIFVQFITNAIGRKAGWRATYSNNCPSLVNIPTNTLFTPSFSVSNYGVTYNITCPVGFVFDSLEFYNRQPDGSLTSMSFFLMTCLMGGVWNVRQTPQCVRRYCGQAPPITNGYVQQTTGAVFGSSATYRCAEGFYMIGSASVTCQENGTWQTPPVCSVVTCPNRSNSIVFGIVRRLRGDGFSAGTVFSYSCDPGYRMQGIPLVSCSTSGNWSSSSPNCSSKVQCFVPTLSHGTVVANGQTFVDYSTSLTVSCTPGYTLVGNATITCQQNRTFTPLPVCQDANECISNPCPAHSNCFNTEGSYSCSCLAGFTANGSACVDVSECAVNNGGCSHFCYELNGSYSCDCPSDSVLFVRNGIMGFYIPPLETGLRYGDTFFINHTCVRRQCPAPPIVPNGYLSAKRLQYNVGDTLTVSCLPDFILKGDDTLTCLPNGTWSAVFPVCEVATCQPDIVPVNLRNRPVLIDPSGPVDVGKRINITCNVPGIGTFNKTRTCRFHPGSQQFHLQGDPYECGVVDCGKPILPMGGVSIPAPNTTTYGSTFQFDCSLEYSLEGTNNLGTKIITCAGNAYWTFFNITCIRRQCPNPGLNTIGDVRFQVSGFNSNDNVTFSCLRYGFQPNMSLARCGLSENGKSLEWVIDSTVSCVDVQPPTFASCPGSSLAVMRYSPAGFTIPRAYDNSGSLASVTVSPAYFYPTQPVDRDTRVIYTATDHSGLSANCTVNVLVIDVSPPTVQCPAEQIIYKTSNDTVPVAYNLSSAGVKYNASDASIRFSPGALNFSNADIGKVVTVTATAQDASNNTAICQFQVMVKARKCQPYMLSSTNTQQNCTQTASGGYICTFTCTSNTYFYDGYVNETYVASCEPGNDYNTSFVPSCVASNAVGMQLEIVEDIVYTAEPSEPLTGDCIVKYQDSLVQTLQGMSATFKQICINFTNVTSISYMGLSIKSLYNGTDQKLTLNFRLRLIPYDGSIPAMEDLVQCYSKLSISFDELSSGPQTLSMLKNISVAGSCPVVTAVGQSHKQEWACDSSYRLRQLYGSQVSVCLPCPTGTSKDEVCVPCRLGTYWVSAPYPTSGQCLPCVSGTATANIGSLGPSSCVDICRGNFVSVSGVPPCRECGENSFQINSTYCQTCPNNTLALRKENPLFSNCLNPEDCYCATKCKPGFYSVTGYANCTACPVGFYSDVDGSTECKECPAGQTSLVTNASTCINVTCLTNPCQNGGVCSVPLHEAFCTCLVGYTGQYCETAINFCASSPCYNNGTCVNSTSGFTCRCPSGFNGSRCEENINDCPTNACSGRGICIDGINSYTCHCFDNFNGINCQTKQLNGCDIFPCGANSTCRPSGDYYRVCDCFPGFTGPLCSTEIDECESQPCLNGGVCKDRVNGYTCSCQSNFTGSQCELPAQSCNSAECGVKDLCVDDHLTGLPVCVCSLGYTQGRLCQYSITTDRDVSAGTVAQSAVVGATTDCRSLCDNQGAGCVAFLYEVNTRNCTLYPQAPTTKPYNGVSGVKVLSYKRCFYPSEAYFYTEWFNSNNAGSSGRDDESYQIIQGYGVTVCENTLPVGVECRVASNQTGIPTGVTCILAGLTCSVANGSAACPDMEVRYRCARSRVFLGKRCELKSICGEIASPCASGTCVDDPANPKGYRCVSCSAGFTGDRCHLSTDECSSQPCQNGGTCIDKYLSYTCSCIAGFTGINCEQNPNDCDCNLAGTENCKDGLNDFTCNCKPGYTGKNCSVNIDECASNPCLNGAQCIDQVNGFRCNCFPGWEGSLCDSVLNPCTSYAAISCNNGGICQPLFNDYSCSCPNGTFGKNCQIYPAFEQCAINNPCVDKTKCISNGDKATCYCSVQGVIGLGCELYASYTCNNTQCLNGGTCFETASGPICNCPPGYAGSNCSVNVNDCATANCTGLNAQCVDGVNKAFCRCPVGKAPPGCQADINEDYDLCFSPSLSTAGAALPYAITVQNLQGFTVIIWVRYSHPNASGSFLTVYSTSSSLTTNTIKRILRLNEAGLEVSLFGATRTLTFDLTSINDGAWHQVVFFWRSSTGDLDLTVDYVRQYRLRSYGSSQLISMNLWFVLGGEKNSPALATSSFNGCLKGVNFLSRGLDFTSDLPSLHLQPWRYQGDLLRWAEFEMYGNVKVVRPSTARLVNCVANPTLADCIVQTRDSEAPKLITCPSDIVVDTIYQDALVSWTPPVFSGSVSLTSSHQPGASFQRGSTVVVYTAVDQAGNTATCSFTVFVAGEAICPELKQPRGLGTQTCEWSNSTFDACSGSCQDPTAKFVSDVPLYYTCDSAGAWNTLQDDEGLYPTCGRVLSPARADVTVSLNYFISAGECSAVTRGLVAKGRVDLASLLQAWGGDLCRLKDCNDVTPIVDCTMLSNTKMEIHLYNVSKSLTSGSLQRSISDVWTSAVLDNRLFSFVDVVPGIDLNEPAYTVQVTFVCEPGQVARGELCVECGPGTYYNSTSRLCRNCPVGFFMSGYAALACTPCPAGLTTRSIGSTSASDCATSCSIGQYYNGSRCLPCAVSFYQNQTGQFLCQPCPRGYLTLNPGSTSYSQCAEACDSGYELLSNGTCVPCALGFYRLFSIQQVCLACPEGYTTPIVAAISADNCTVLLCPEGSRANATQTGCELCPVGAYQPRINQISCLPCPVNHTTVHQGSVNMSQCQRFCPSGYELVADACVPCPLATYKDYTINPFSSCTACPPGYITAGERSTASSACSIRNCTAGFFIQKDSQGVETCALCPVDSYSSQNYQTSCSLCPSNSGTLQPGADSASLCQTFCPSGQELVNGTCRPCGLGYYKDNNVSRFASCSLCPEEFITSNTGTPTLSSCNIRNCTAGSYREGNNNTCMNCPLNTYQPDRWQTSCLSCPSNSFTEITGAVNSSQCLLNCGPGQEDKQGVCMDCALGFYKNRTGATSCTACPEGFRTSSSGSRSVVDCNIAACRAGTYLDAAANTCRPCLLGQYQPNRWNDSCLPCPSGNTTYVTGAVSLSQCLTNCSLGAELNLVTGLCLTCARGYYRDGSLGTCTLCPGNYITSGIGATSVSQCAVANCTVPGMYLNASSNTCQHCPIGTYNSQWWAESCTQCPAGFTTKTAGISAVTSCFRDCPSGQQVNEATNECSKCPLGNYRNKTQGMWTCQPCRAPFTTASEGAVSQDDCSIITCTLGQYYNSSQSQCLLCPMGTYQSLPAQRSCTPCPGQNITRAAGSISLSDCISKCSTVENNCPSSALCSINSAGNIICTCKPNYIGNGETCTHVCDLTEPYCKNGGICIKDRESACTCADYYFGNQCETRADPSKAVKNVEVIVGVVVGVVVFLLLVLLLLIGIFVRRRRQRIPSDKDTLSTSTHSHPPSAIIPRMNTQGYSQSFVAKSVRSRGYDPAYYNAAEANNDSPSFVFENQTYR